MRNTIVRSIVTAPVLLGFLLVVTGCVQGRASDASSDSARSAYLKARAWDLSDILWVSGGVGVGLEADFQATELSHSGLGFSLRKGLEFRQREFESDRLEVALGYVLGREVHARIFGHPESVGHLVNIRGLLARVRILRGRPDQLNGLLGEAPGSATQRVQTVFAGIPSGPTFPPSHWTDVADVEVGAMAGLIGARLRISPGEFADFVCGWLRIDIAHDD